MSKPYFTISADGVDISGRLRGAGVTMTITDNEGLKSDTLQIVIDDVNGSVAAPRTGAVLNPIGGYEGRMRDFGLFIVDGVTYTGWPQQISISAKAVAAKSLAKQRDPKAYPKEKYATYGDIFAEVAGRVGLSLKISAELKDIKVEYEAQSEESALEFLTRIGEDLGASISVKANNLIAVIKGQGLSASGTELPMVVVARGKNILKYSVSEKDEPKHSKVETSYYDRKQNKKIKVEVETGMDGPTFRMRTQQQDKASAERKGKAMASKLVRDAAEASFEIDGDPFAQAEAHAMVSGCRSNVDGVWRIKSVTHQFSATGPYTTSLSCTAPSSDKAKQSGKKASSGNATSGGSGKPKTGMNPAGAVPKYESGAPSLTGDPSTNIG